MSTPFSMSGLLDELLAVLDLTDLGDDVFKGRCQANGWVRVFGGQVVGQALVAAARTVPADRPPHSLHAYFLLGGDPRTDIRYVVERLRDGGSFGVRRVDAIQHDRTIFSMSASFQRVEPGFDHAAVMPDTPPPEDVADARRIVADHPTIVPKSLLAYFTRPWPIELRPVEARRYLDRDTRPTQYRVWLRTADRLPDDPAIHRAVLAYASDMTLLDATLIAHGTTVFDPRIQSASLDHALWFHRPFRIDDWLLYVQDSPSASGARGFARGALYDRGGCLVASVGQEGLIRQRTDRSRDAPPQ